jgi:hypothetical protein
MEQAAALGPCPEPDRLRGLLEGEGPEADRLRLLDHVMACPSCTEDFALIRAVAGDAPAGVSRRRTDRRFLTLAASVVIVAGVGAGAWALSQGDGPVTYRDEGASPITLLAPVAGGEGSTRRFVWHAVEDAVEYRFEIFDASGAALFAETTRDTVLLLPEETALDTSVPLNWWVRARLRDGSEVSSNAEPFGGAGA